MVTRKLVAPPLNTAPNAASSSQPPYPTTPDLDDARHLHSAKSVYSPDLGTSPAFDLIDMDQARQQRPRRDSDVSSHGTWDSEDSEEREERDHHTPDDAAIPKPLRITPSKQNIKEDSLPASLRPGPAEVVTGRKSQEALRYEAEAQQANPWVSSTEQRQQEQHAAIAQEMSGATVVSHNPYRQPNSIVSETSQAEWEDLMPAPSHAPPAPPVELPTMHTPADELSNMALGESTQHPASPPFQTAEVIPVPQQGQPPLASVIEQDQQEGQNLFSNNPWRRPSQEEAAVQPPAAPAKAPIPPVAEPQYAPPPGPPPKGAATTLLHDRQQPTAASPPGPQSPLTPTQQPTISTQSNTTSGTPQTRVANQRSEHYQIKHVNWYDASYSSDPRFKDAVRRSPILTQNANGPCPLLALVNALVLSTPQNLDTALIETLRTREQVSLGLLLDAVFDELMSGRRGDTASDLPDVGELYSFLLALHTGMNVNPRFVTPAQAPRGSLDGYPPDETVLHPAERAQSKPGCFEETKEMRLYSTFNIPLIHGWTAPNDTPAYAAFSRSAQTFEDAQNIQFAEAELLDKQRSHGLSFAEEQTLQDISTIKSFLRSWPTQLTDYGLETLSQSLKPGQIAILFRNDHFSTLYKEPTHGALMTLVTDTGYSSHDEIVWESLVDVQGAASELFAGDFRAVSHGPSDIQEGSSRSNVPLRVTNNVSPLSSRSRDENPPPLPGPRPGGSTTPTPGEGAGSFKSIEQEDHDLALALQLQEEEEDQQRQAEDRRRREQELSEQFLEHEGEGVGGARPPIPPRRSNNPGNNNTNPAPAPQRTNNNTPAPRPRQPLTARRASADDPDAPPTYEQSSSDRVYRPPGEGPESGGAGRGRAHAGNVQQGNPLSAYDALRRQQQVSSPSSPSSAYAQQQSTMGAAGVQGRRQSGQPMRRRSSAMGPGMPGSFGGGAGPSRVSQAPGIRDAEEKCCVM